MNIARGVTLIFVGLLWPAVAFSDSVTIGASKDTAIYANDTTMAGGGAPAIFSGIDGMGRLRRSLFAFDIAGNVPAGSTITGVQLTLYVANAAGSGSQSIGLYPLSADWGEGTAGSTQSTVNGSGGGFTETGNGTTWTERFHGGALWTTAGGDFGAASATASVGNTADSAVSWLSTAALVSNVQGWLNNPSTNYGWLLRHATETGSANARGFYARTAGDANSPGLNAAFRPALTVTYVPEPATAALLLLTAPLALARRRK